MPDLRAAREPDARDRARARGRAGWMIAAGDRAAARRRRILRLHQLLPEARGRRRRRGDAAAAPPHRPSPRRPAGAEEVRARDGRRVSRDQARRPRRCWPRASEFAQGRRAWPRPSSCSAAPPKPATRRPSSSSPPSTIRSSTPPKAGFTPDGARAADWYERAALAGIAEAQRKFGLLLAKGGAGLPADPGQAPRPGCSRRRRRTTPRPRRRWTPCRNSGHANCCKVMRIDFSGEFA